MELLFDHQLELSWAAGFYDGEGCTSIHVDKYLRCSITQKYPELLERFNKALGIEKRILGPYLAGGIYRVVVNGREAHLILDKLWPYLGSVKRAQAIRSGYVPL